MTDQPVFIPLADRTEADVREKLKGHAPETIEAFVQAQAFARQHNLGFSALAAKLRVSTGTLSPCYSGTYNGNYDNIAESIRAFFRRQENKEKFGDIRAFVELNLTQYVWLVCEKTSINRRIQILEGPEQCGKTRALTEYSERNNRGSTVYLDISGGSISGVNDFIRKLAGALGMGEGVKLTEARVRIRHALESAELVIIDEIHLVWKWTPAAIGLFFDYLRTDIHANGSRGVLLASTNDAFFDRLQTFKKSGYNVGQLLGRMRNEAVVIDPAEHIIEEDVQMLAARYYDKPGRAAVALLHRLAVQPQMGHYGLVIDILNEAWIEARKRKRGLDDDTVKSTAERIVAKMKANKNLYVQ